MLSTSSDLLQLSNKNFYNFSIKFAEIGTLFKNNFFEFDEYVLNMVLNWIFFIIDYYNSDNNK